MASVYSSIITDNSLYKPTFKLDFQCLKPPAPSDAMSWFPSPSYKVNLSEDREISDSDDDSLPSVRKILACLKQKEVIDLTADDDDGGGDSDEEDVIEVSGLRNRLNPCEAN